MALTDAAIRKAKPADKGYKLKDGGAGMRDGGGLYLRVETNGSKLWRLDYRRPVTGKPNTLSLGTYPAIGLIEARSARDAARRLLAQGIDPSEARKANKAAGIESAANSFNVLANEWLALQTQWTDGHRKKQESRLNKHLRPYIGAKPIRDIGVSDLRPILKRLTDAGHHEQAHRVLSVASDVFKYAVASERAERNPAADLRAALPPRRKKHFATITDPVAVGHLLRALPAHRGMPEVGAALRLVPLVFVRPGELRGMKWAEIDFDHPEGAQWVIPAARQKLRKAQKESALTQPYIVPLSDQAVEILREIQPLSGHREHVFPGKRDPKRSISDGAINAALQTLGIPKETIVPHGFRHMASTLLNELGFDGDAIERQLSHKERGVRGVYNQAKHLPERRRMMQHWANYLDQLRDNTGKVVPMKRKVA